MRVCSRYYELDENEFVLNICSRMNKNIKFQMQTSKVKCVEVQFVEDKDVNLILRPLQSQRIRESSKRQSKGPPSSDEESVIPVQNKPSNLFEKGDVGGQQLFGFQTPKRHNSLASKVTFSPDISKTPVHRIRSLNDSPKVNRSSTKKKNVNTLKETEIEEDRNEAPAANPQTPYSLRKRLKSKIAATRVEKNCSDESEDFSASESEYEESGSSSSGSDSQEESDRDSSPAKRTYLSKQDVPSSRRKNKLNFVPAAEEYFQSHASKKVLTSNRTLGRLRHQLPQEQLQKLLSNVSCGHGKFYKRLQNEKEYLFKKWNLLLSEGFNILLFGVGSKRSLLSSFHEQITEPCIVVNGFFPSLSIQEIVSSVAEDILRINTSSLDTLELVDRIKDAFSHKKSSHLYVVVHNLDGVMLRNNKNQGVLAALSRAVNVHFIASVDHVSSALMWDQHILSTFNFLWWDVTSFEPYTEETAFESSLLVQQSGRLALSSLQSVFHSLTSNAKSIFLLMAEYQKANKKSSQYNGMAFKKLYSLCRESLLVSSDLALRSQLTEFLDHKLLKSRRGTDGSELLVIPIDSVILNQFISQQGDT